MAPIPPLGPKNWMPRQSAQLPPLLPAPASLTNPAPMRQGQLPPLFPVPQNNEVTHLPWENNKWTVDDMNGGGRGNRDRGAGAGTAMASALLLGLTALFSLAASFR
jgi:hypothetical protein